MDADELQALRDRLAKRLRYDQLRAQLAGGELSQTDLARMEAEFPKPPIPLSAAEQKTLEDADAAPVEPEEPPVAVGEISAEEREQSRALARERLQLVPDAEQVALLKAHDGLAHLLGAFGYSPLDGLNAVPKPKEKYTSAEHQAEVLALLPAIDETNARVDRLRASLARPGGGSFAETFAQEWLTVVESWNAAVEKVVAKTIPRLCENCGTPIFQRESPRTCSEACADTVRTRARRQSKK